MKTLVITTDGTCHITHPLGVHDGNASSAGQQLFSKGGTYYAAPAPVVTMPHIGRTEISMPGGPTLILVPLPPEVEVEGREASFALSLGLTAGYRPDRASAAT